MRCLKTCGPSVNSERGVMIEKLNVRFRLPLVGEKVVRLMLQAQVWSPDMGRGHSLQVSR